MKKEVPHNFLFYFVTTSLLETDQVLLMRYFWPWAKTMMLQHDSFHCDLFAKSRAWPSQRPEGLNNFVGVPVSLNSTLTDECPLRCRPREHPEWKQCWASVRQRPNEPKGKGRYKAKVPSRMNLRETKNDFIELNEIHLHFYWLILSLQYLIHPLRSCSP